MKTNEAMQRVPLADIVPSKTNPRKQFNGPDWPEFVANIKQHGVIQPGVARPIAKQVGAAAQLNGKYELVCGERRYRASKDAGHKDMPLVVRELTDAQVLEIQQIENLQRADLSPLEEAQGYADWRDALMKAGTCKTVDAAVEHIAAKIDRKRSTVFARLALLKTTPKVQAALVAGQIDVSKAGLLAVIADAVSQEQCLKEATEKDWDGSVMSVRDLQQHIEQEYRRNLKDAQFDQAKVFNFGGKLPSAPACNTCALKVGNHCTSPACFAAKQKAHVDAMLNQAKSAGKPVMGEKEYAQVRHRCIKSDYPCYYAPKTPTYGELAKKVQIQPFTTVDDGELVEVFTQEQVKRIEQNNGVKSAQYNSSGTDRTRLKRHQENYEKAKLATGKVLAALVTAKGVDERLWRLLADGVAGLIGMDREAFVAKRRGLAAKNGEVRENLEAWLSRKDITTREMQEFTVEALLCSSPLEWEGHLSADFKALCALAKVDTAKVQTPEPKPAKPAPAKKAKKGKAKK